MIEAAVYLGRVEIFCYQRQSVDFRAGAFGIDTATPIGIRPTGGTNMNISASAHQDDCNDRLSLDDGPIRRGPHKCGR